MTQSRRHAFGFGSNAECTKCHILGKMYDVRHGMCKKCYMGVWRLENKERARTNFGKCSGCGQQKRILFFRLRLCSYCHDNRRYGGRENYRKFRREQTREYRKTPQYAVYKIKSKGHQKLYNAKWRKENSQKHRRAKRRWTYTHRENHRIGERRRSHRRYYAGKMVGPFDPNELLNKRLLKAVEKVREGNLKPLKLENAYE
jgi:hypothetical protein